MSTFEGLGLPEKPAPLKAAPVQPLFNNILAEREAEEKYTGTLIIPETVREAPMGARVIAVGPDVRFVKPGDFILVGKFAGASVKFRHRDYTVIREDEILGIVDESV